MMEEISTVTVKCMKAASAGDEKTVREQMGRIFVEGFYGWLKYFGKDKARLAKAFEHIFDLDRFYVAVSNTKIVSICAANHGKTPPISLDAAILKSHLGFIKGRLADKMLNLHLIRKVYPFEIAKDCGIIEYVATCPEHRGLGIAKTLIKYSADNSDYNEFILEVAENNTVALAFYEKLGFSEFARIPEHGSRFSGVSVYVYMKYKVNEQ